MNGEKNTLEYWRERGRAKIADFQHYATDFGAIALGNICIGHDIIREADDYHQGGLSVYGTFLEVFPDKFRGLYRLDEFKEDSFINCAYPEVVPGHDIKISEPEIVETLKSGGNYKRDLNWDTVDLLLPVKGKPEIQEEVLFPKNKECVIGTMRLHIQRKDLHGDTDYFERIAGRIGSGLHHGYLMLELKRMNEYVRDFGREIFHDIKNPIVGMGAGAKFARKSLQKLNLPEEIRKRPEYKDIVDNLDYIQTESGRSELLLRMAASNSPYEMRTLDVKKEPVDLVEIMERVLYLKEPKIKSAKTKLTKFYMTDRAGIAGDGFQLTLLFNNLLDNAMWHGDKRFIEVGIDDDVDEYVSYVKNSGRGIQKKYQKLIFDDMFKGDESGGMGIGLWSVKRIADMHGAKIEVDSDGKSYANFITRFRKLD